MNDVYLHLQAFSPEEFVLFHTILSLRSWAWRIRIPEPEPLWSCCKAILLTTSLLITAGEVMIRWHPWTEIPCFGPGEIHDNLFENPPHQDFISFPRCFLDTYKYYLLCCCPYCSKCPKTSMSSENEGCGERISDLRSFSFSASRIRSSVVKWVRECSNISLMNIIAKNSPKTVSFLKMPIEQLSLTSSDNLIWSLRLNGSTSFRNKQFLL